MFVMNIIGFFEQFQKEDLKDLRVTGENLVEKTVVKQLGKSTAFVVNNVEFQPGPLGNREISICWRYLEDYIRVQVAIIFVCN